MSPARSLLSVAAVLVGCAIVAASPGCSSFTEDTSGADSGNETSTDAGTTTDAPQDSGGCATSCPPGVTCIDRNDPGWMSRTSGDSALTRGEPLISSVPQSGAAFLDLMAKLVQTRGVVLSLDVTIDALPKNGTTLAKIVDAAGNEVNL